MLYCCHCSAECFGLVQQILPICDTCTAQDPLLPVAERQYSYKRDGKNNSDKHREILRKIGQNRLPTNILVHSIGFFGRAEYVPLWKHKDFAGLYIQDSVLYAQVHAKKTQEQHVVQKMHSSNRNSKILGSVFALVLMGVGWYGYQEKLFLVDFDPFSAFQRNQGGIPAPVQDYIAEILQRPVQGRSVKMDKDSVMDYLQEGDPQKLLTLRRQLAEVLAEHPLQGNELLWLLYIELQIQPDWNSVWTVWKDFAFTLPHATELDDQLLALWWFRQENVEKLKTQLGGCTQTPLCMAIMDYMHLGQPQVDVQQLFGIALVIFAQKQLHEKNVENYEQVGNVLISKTPNMPLGYILLAEALLHKQSHKEALEMIEKSIEMSTRMGDTHMDSLILWRLRLQQMLHVSTETQIQNLPDIQKISPLYRDVVALHMMSVYLQQKEYSRMQELVPLINNTDTRNKSLLLLTRMHVEQGALSEARKSLSQIASKFEDPLLEFHRGWLSVQIQDVPSAIDISESFSKYSPYRWLIQSAVAIQTNNMRMLEQTLEQACFSDQEMIWTMHWQNAWLPAISTAQMWTSGVQILNDHVHKDEYTLVLRWVTHQPDFPTTKLAGLPKSKAHTQTMAAQILYTQAVREDKKAFFTQAQGHIQKARGIQSNNPAIDIVYQLVNAGIGREQVTIQELQLISQKHNSPDFAHWMEQGFLLAGREDVAQQFRLVLEPALEDREISASYVLLLSE